jgi:hypothetical protein
MDCSYLLQWQVKQCILHIVQGSDMKAAPGCPAWFLSGVLEYGKAEVAADVL